MYWHRRLDAGDFFLTRKRRGLLATVLTIFCLSGPIHTLPRLHCGIAGSMHKTILLAFWPGRAFKRNHLTGA
jgi:hypothetical protein